MNRIARPRHYVAPWALIALRPLFVFSPARRAYVLRLIGDHRGPVLRPCQRRRWVRFEGPERRQLPLAVHAFPPLREPEPAGRSLGPPSQLA